MQFIRDFFFCWGAQRYSPLGIACAISAARKARNCRCNADRLRRIQVRISQLRMQNLSPMPTSDEDARALALQLRRLFKRGLPKLT